MSGLTAAEREALGLRIASCGCCYVVDMVALRELADRARAAVPDETLARALAPCGPDSVDAWDKRNHPCGCATYFDLALWRSINHRMCDTHAALRAARSSETGEGS